MVLKLNSLRTIILTWTLLTTTFFWTSTMRILFKPDISSWRIFELGGKGFVGEFWFPPLIAIIALFAFYLEGRGKYRLIFYFLLISWHILISGLVLYGSFSSDSVISFGTWGIALSMKWLVLPFKIFLVLAIFYVFQEYRIINSIPLYKWNEVNKKLIITAVLLFPVSFLFFHLGEGFNLMVKIAVVVTIIQWILLVETVGRPD